MKFRYICVTAAIILLPLKTQKAYCEEMVEVSVEITEVNNNKAHELGVEWPSAIKTGEVMWSASNRLPAALPEVPSIIKVGDWARFTELTATLNFLQQKGAAQILSKPKILTKSGTTAKFLVGGQFPVTAVGATTSSIEWKDFGIKTEVTPRIMADQQIDLVLTTEVSRIDASQMVNNYPVITTRQSTSSVKVKSGQTISLAGMIETKNENFRSGIPLLCDLPVLGYLFSKETSKETKTNVIIFVTPRIVD
ncbi:MAG TPA: hypothetical protein DEE98_00020 [Elusimicrobia bacterium]|nr:MAG: hypothetical protein A2386_07080 [Elusimicrobia bacterium RIFOXYB1_FULL_48_9]OGS16703.1 MAG: hypothetical protein A2251_00785 [Elusimicrobia bacterium RIFOXYA2_FULL_47_53]OGS26756.1 MAG: hypothetical protein A2339_04040 [Elusimicrobia bacterium RIFOXYB12_FULL_50_12]OGS31662.1 MAG: hypothetical protein A2323_05615 [Elusimicrobia bacterium RIFOXYB2_FULL_46_23]HBU68750.1 hypothetical protein [Elusimicrobiota bacterium]